MYIMEKEEATKAGFESWNDEAGQQFKVVEIICDVKSLNHSVILFFNYSV
jgi:hypothetical protein